MPRCIPLTRIVVILLALAWLNACRTTPMPPMAPKAKAPAAPIAVAKPVATQAPVSKLPSVALLDFESGSLAPAETIAVSQALWVQLRRPDEIGLLPRDETRRWLIANDLYPYMPLQKEIPLGRVVEALRVDYLLTGRIERVGKNYTVSMTLTGRDGLPVLQNSMDVQGGPTELTRAIERIAPVFRKTIIGVSKPAAPRPTKLASDKKIKTRVSRAPVQERDVEKIAADKQKPAVVAAVNTDAAAVKPAATPTPTPTPTPTATPTPTPTPKHTPKPTPTATPAPTPTPTATTFVLRASSSPKPETVTPTPKATVAPPAAAASDPVSRARAMQKEANQLAPKSEKRLELLKQAVALAPNDAQVLRGLANEYYLRENFSECVDIYSKALKLDPNNSMLLTFRGSAQYCQDQLTEASADFARAVEIDPNNHFARYNLALSAHMRKSPDAAKLWREYLDKSVGAADQDDQRKEAKRYLATLGK